MIHKEVNRYRFMHACGCYMYRINCSCGQECGGWTPDEAEKDFDKHKVESEQDSNGSD